MSPIHFCTCSNCNCTATILNGNGNIEVGHLFCIMWLNVGQFKILFQHTVTFELPDMNISSYNTTQFPITIKDKTANSDKVKDNAGVRDQLGAVHMKYLFEYSSFMNYNYLSKVVIFFLNFALSDVWNGQNIKKYFYERSLSRFFSSSATEYSGDHCYPLDWSHHSYRYILMFDCWFSTDWLTNSWISNIELVDADFRMNAENEIHYCPLSSVE